MRAALLSALFALAAAQIDFRDALYKKRGSDIPPPDTVTSKPEEPTMVIECTLDLKGRCVQPVEGMVTHSDPNLEWAWISIGIDGVPADPQPGNDNVKKIQLDTWFPIYATGNIHVRSVVGSRTYVSDVAEMDEVIYKLSLDEMMEFYEPPDGTVYVASALKFLGVAKDAVFGDNWFNRWNETKFQIAVAEALNKGRNVCSPGKGCHDAFREAEWVDVLILEMKPKQGTIVYQVAALDDEFMEVESILRSPYFKYPLFLAMKSLSMHFAQGGALGCSADEYLMVDSENSATMMKKVVVEGGLSGAEIAGIVIALVLVLVGVVFVVYKSRQNDAREKDLDDREQELNKRLEDLETHRQSLANEAEGLRRQKNQMEGERASLESQLKEQEMALMSEDAKAKFRQLDSEEQAEKEQEKEIEKEIASLASRNPRKQLSTVAASLASLSSQRQKAQKAGASEEVRKLEAQEASQAQLIAKLAAGEALAKSEEDLISALVAEQARNSSEITDATAIEAHKQKEQMQQRLAARSLKRQELLKQKQNAADEAARKQAEQQLQVFAKEEEVTMVIVQKLEAGQTLESKEKEAVDNMLQQADDIMAQFEVNSAKLEQAQNQEAAKQRAALEAKLEQKRAKRQKLNDEKERLAKEQAAAAAAAAAADEAKAREIEQKQKEMAEMRSKLSFVVGKIKSTASAADNKEKEIKRIQKEAALVREDLEANRHQEAERQRAAMEKKLAKKRAARKSKKVAPEDAV